jgi:CubicO group peptidase (beta-lactamase class C family)
MFTGGGGLVSTMSDYSKFIECLLSNSLCKASGKKLIKSQELFNEMTVNQLPNGGDLAECTMKGSFTDTEIGMGFGLGFMMVLDKTKLKIGGGLVDEGLYGWSGLASTQFRINPKEKTALIVMAQLIPISKREELHRQVVWLLHWFFQQ